MAVEESILTYLRSLTSLTDLVSSNNMGWVSVTQNNDYPRLTFEVISRPQSYDNSDQWQRWRFYIVDLSKKRCLDIRDALYTGINSIYESDIEGTQIDYIQKLDETDPLLRDDSMYEKTIDFRIIYH